MDAMARAKPSASAVAMALPRAARISSSSLYLPVESQMNAATSDAAHQRWAATTNCWGTTYGN